MGDISFSKINKKDITVELLSPSKGVFTIPKSSSVRDFVLLHFPKKASLLVGAYINQDSELRDIRSCLQEKDKLKLIYIPSKEALEVIRHSGAHVLAQAVQELWPEVLIATGPVVKNGFYYDFDSKKIFSEEDLKKIEDRMQKIISSGLELIKEDWDKDKALSVFSKMKASYKLELIKDIGQDHVSVYRQGKWFDLCRGPHVQKLSQIGVVKLLRVSGAYWRADESRKQLQRIYGTAFHSKKELNTYLHNQEEAKKRDHRKLGKQMDLFSFSEFAGGSPFFTSKGTIIYNELQSYLRKLYVKYGYQEVITPQVFSNSLFSVSGHLEFFKDNMYDVNSSGTEEKDGFSLKPMNCPGHCVFYQAQSKSYRDLPWRLADFSKLHRKERKGSLHGLTRVSGFCQDDAHVFCTPQQLNEEIKSIILSFKEVYRTLGLDDYQLYLSTKPKKAMGEDVIWEQAKQVLNSVAQSLDLELVEAFGEGAFYGPKLDLVFIDAMDRSWQLGTLQCDFNMPKSFKLSYVDKDNQLKTPVLLHRAILGSLERFIGIYLEHRSGNLPLWLSPVQVVLMNISQDQESYVKHIGQTLLDLGLRVHLDLRSEKLGYKIREAKMAKMPCMLIIGDKEKQAKNVSVRWGKASVAKISVDFFIKKLVETIESKALTLSFT